MDLNGRVVLITGASSGIGEVTALRCAAQGARLVLAARGADRLAALERQIAVAGGQALVVPTDVTEVEQVQRLAATALNHYGQVDVLVNNAGYGILDAFPQACLADLEGMIQVNLYGMVHCTQALLPHMLGRRQGQIINVASLAGIIALPRFAFYSATKFALIGMSRALQLDLRGTGVRCAIICPHAVRTPFFDHADKRKLARATYLIPWLNADDVARTIERAIIRDSSGEIILPAVARPLIALGRASPALAKLVVRLLG